MGIDIELGALIRLSHKIIPDEEQPFVFDLPIWPTIGACVFFRL
jgi:hypothetical protein